MDAAVLHISGETPSAGVIANSVNLSLPDGGDDARLRRAFESCGDDLYRFIALRVSGDRHAADDILQQACYEAARHRRIPSPDGAIQPWMFGIARNIIRKHFRSLRREGRYLNDVAATRVMLPVLQEQADEPVASGAAELAPQLLSAMAALSEADQQLILGSYFEGRSHDELATSIGVSVRAIEGRLYRARQALRAILCDGQGED